MNILSISDGSERSTHAYLPYMAEAAGQEMLLCDLCIDGCSLEQHWDNWRKELPCYEYDICLPGETDTRTVDEVALHEAVEDEEWDVITLRQSRSMSGVEESYLPYLAELAEYCRMMQPKAKIMLIQPWTYDSDSADPSFRRLYGADRILRQSGDRIRYRHHRADRQGIPDSPPDPRRQQADLRRLRRQRARLLPRRRLPL